MSVPVYAVPGEYKPAESATVGTLLTVILYVYAASIVVSLVFTIIRVVSPVTYMSFEAADDFLSPLKWGLFLVVLVVFVMWVYRFHIDLRSISKRYPISPRGALAQILIPLYNI